MNPTSNVTTIDGEYTRTDDKRRPQYTKESNPLWRICLDYTILGFVFVIVPSLFIHGMWLALTDQSKLFEPGFHSPGVALTIVGVLSVAFVGFLIWMGRRPKRRT